MPALRNVTAIFRIYCAVCQVCQHAVDTLNDMLDVAKMEHGTYIPKFEIVDLGEVCKPCFERT